MSTFKYKKIIIFVNYKKLIQIAQPFGSTHNSIFEMMLWGPQDDHIIYLIFTKLLKCTSFIPLFSWLDLIGVIKSRHVFQWLSRQEGQWKGQITNGQISEERASREIKMVCLFGWCSW